MKEKQYEGCYVEEMERRFERGGGEEEEGELRLER